MEIPRLVTILIFVGIVTAKYCDVCDKIWFPNACEMYCCMYRQVCNNTAKYTTNILNKCKCNDSKVIHPYCLMAERGNLKFKHQMCNIISNHPDIQCDLCDNLPPLTTTPKPTPFIYPTLPAGVSTKKPKSEYCRYKEYCYFFLECDCKVFEPTTGQSSAPPTSMKTPAAVPSGSPMSSTMATATSAGSRARTASVAVSHATMPAMPTAKSNTTMATATSAASRARTASVAVSHATMSAMPTAKSKTQGATILGAETEVATVPSAANLSTMMAATGV